LYRQLQIYHNCFNNNFRLSVMPFLFIMANIIVTFTIFTLISNHDTIEPFALLTLLLALLDCFLALPLVKFMESFRPACLAFADELKAQTQCSRAKDNSKKSNRVTVKFVQSLFPLRIYLINNYVQQEFFLQFINSNIHNIIFLLVK